MTSKLPHPATVFQITPTQIEDLSQQIVDTRQLVRYQSEVESQKRLRLQREADCRQRAVAAGRPLPPPGRLRLPGGGRKTLMETQPDLLPAIYAMFPKPETQDFIPPLQWTTTLAKELATYLQNQGFYVSESSISSLLRRAGLRAHPHVRIPKNRPSPKDKQFDFINRAVMETLRHGQRVYFVDLHLEYGDPSERHETIFSYNGRLKIIANHITNALEHQWYDLQGEEACPMVVMEGGTMLGIDSKYLHNALIELAKKKGMKVLLSYLPSGISRWTCAKRDYEVKHNIPTIPYGDMLYLTFDTIQTETPLPCVADDSDDLWVQFYDEMEDLDLWDWNRVFGVPAWQCSPKMFVAGLR